MWTLHWPQEIIWYQLYSLFCRYSLHYTVNSCETSSLQFMTVVLPVTLTYALCLVFNSAITTESATIVCCQASDVSIWLPCTAWSTDWPHTDLSLDTGSTAAGLVTNTFNISHACTYLQSGIRLLWCLNFDTFQFASYFRLKNFVFFSFSFYFSRLTLFSLFKYLKNICHCTRSAVLHQNNTK